VGGWKAPPFRLPCRFSDYRALISTSGQVKLDDHEDEERRKGKSALGARERGVGAMYPVELLGVRHSLRGGLRIPGVPPFDPIASYPGLSPAYVFTPDFFSTPSHSRVPPSLHHRFLRTKSSGDSTANRDRRVGFIPAATKLWTAKRTRARFEFEFNTRFSKFSGKD